MAASRLEELERIVNRLQDALRSKGASDDEINEIMGDVTSPLLAAPEEEEEEEKGLGAPLYRQRAFIEGSMQAQLDIEKIIEAVGNFHRKYFSLPNVEIRYKNLSYTAKVDLSEPAIKTVGNQNPLGKMLHKIVTSRSAKRDHRAMETEHKILDSCCGILKPRSLTLVIGAPGCGKSSFLRGVCGLLRKKTATTNLTYDECSYNGQDLYAPKSKRAFVPSKVAAFIEQIDKHIPTLTVDETLKFAQATFAAGEPLSATELNPDVFDVAKSAQASKAMPGKKLKYVAKDESFATEAAEADEFVKNSVDLKLDCILRILGIDHVRNTIVGNAAIRGVSGGQRRRVTVGEMLMGKGRVICGDEISTGLDSQTTFEITRAFRWFAKHMDLTVILSLLQPPPESFNLFDDVILLHDGAVAYHGPTTGILSHFNAVHLAPPPRKDVADFLVEITSSEELATTYCTNASQKVDITALPAQYRETSDHYKQILADLDVPTFSEDQPFPWTTVYAEEFTKPLTYYWFVCLRRKVIELHYNPAYLKTRFGQALGMGIFTGTLFYQLDHDEFATKFGLIFSSSMYLALGGMSAIPKKVEDRTVFYKQRDQSFFPSISYALADIVIDSTTVFFEALVYINLVFWPSGLASEGYGIFLVVLLVMALAMNQWFAAVASFAPDAQSGQPLAGMSVLLCVLFSGFIVQRENIPPGWKWLHWMSPIALAFRALAINEFRSDRYDKCTYQVREIGCPDDDALDDDAGCCVESTDGIFFLKVYSVLVSPMWIGVGIAILLFYFLFFVWLTTLCLTKVRHIAVAGGGSWIAMHSGDADPPFVGAPTDDPQGTQDLVRRYASKDDAKASQRHIDAAKEEASSEKGEIPYQKTTLAFWDLHYSVSIPSKQPFGPADTLELLGGVTGYAKPATMTALMGSSGAGKTTLLDVIACRKTSGKITGDLTLNGFPLDPATFTRISGYVEQLDVHQQCRNQI